MLCEMQSVSPRIWTRVVVSISNDNKHYTTSTSLMHTYIDAFLPAKALLNLYMNLGTEGLIESQFQQMIKHYNNSVMFWPSARAKCHSRWCTGRKRHIPMAVMWGNRVGGNWLMKWDELKKFPWYTHRLMHRKRVTSELHDSYFCLMTIKHSISKIE